MTVSHPSLPEDIDAIRDWFARLNTQVNALDYAAARSSVSEDFIAFGTFADFLVGVDEAEARQWRNVWHTITDFNVRLADIRGFVSPDRLYATGLAFFDSTGFDAEGKPFPRTGRATVTFVRNATTDPWVANHSHMSLMRGTPTASHGSRT